MTLTAFAFFIAAMVCGTGLGLLAFAIHSTPHPLWCGRHHDHLLPTTPARVRSPRG